MIDLRQNKGFALTFSLIFLFLIVSFMAVYIMVVANGVSEATHVANAKKAYYVADAGLADAYERIVQAGSNFVIPTPGTSYIPSATTDSGIYSVGNATGNYNVTIAITNSPAFNYTITSVGAFGNESKTLQLKITWSSISKYTYWSQTENSPLYGQLWWVGIGVPNAPGSFVYMTTGPVQTNGTLNIFGNPIFDGAVSEGNGDGGNTPNYYYGSSLSANPYGLVSNPNEIFPDGLTNNAPPITLPPQATLSFLNAEASDGSGLVLTGNSTVIFNPTGTITVTGNVMNPANCTVTTIAPNSTMTYNNTTIPAPANGVIYIQSTSKIPACNSSAQDGNVTVQGTVSGQLTVAADQNMYISGSVAYNDDPRPTATNPAGNPNSTDLVGLVANQNITVVQASAFAQDGPSIELAGVMVALQGSFQADNWWTYMGPATGPGAAIMDQFGSLINYVCGATGEIDMSGDLLGGWNQQQSYDARLAKMSPPGFAPLFNTSGNEVYSKLSIQECNAGVCG